MLQNYIEQTQFPFRREIECALVKTVLGAKFNAKEF